MRFLSLAERELRAKARRPGLYRLRWITVAAFLVLLVWLSWEYDLFHRRWVARSVFETFSFMTFLFCLFIGATGTADCVSRERREGTLGLLFLTNLNSAEIVAGKLCSNALAAFYSLLAMFPLLALPLLVGGITLGAFWRTVLALLNTLFFAMAAGFVASTVSVRQFPAIALATGLSLLWGVAWLGAAEVTRRFGAPTGVTHLLESLCPLYTIISAQSTGRALSQARFWPSLAAVTATSCAWLGLVTWRLVYVWRDRPKSPVGWNSVLGRRLRQRGCATRAAFRRRCLKINPFFWLAGRQRVSAPVFMLLTVALVCITVTLSASFPNLIRAGPLSPVIGHLFAWFWAGLALHALVLYYGATAASQRLAEDKHSGALELILSTPVTQRIISRGLWLAYARRMFFPALSGVLVHGYFLWVCANALLLESALDQNVLGLPGNLSPGRLLWCALLNQPMGSARLPWEIAFLLRCAILSLVVLVTTWITAGWLGRWLGLRMKHPGFAPLTTVTLILVPPVLLFSVLCYLVEEWKMWSMPERRLFPLMMWAAFGIGTGYCALLSAWAVERLRHDFRATATSRFQPPSTRRWWSLERRTVLRLAKGTTVAVLTIGLAILLFHGYQNRQSRKRWSAFQIQLQQRGEALALDPILPAPAAPEQNLARSPAFRRFLTLRASNGPPAALLNRIRQHAIVGLYSGGTSPSTSWMKRNFMDFDTHLLWLDPTFQAAATKDRTNRAVAVLNALQPLQPDLRALAAATHLARFQVNSNRTSDAVFQSNLRELSTLQQIHVLLQMRACASLALGRTEEAGEDVLSSLRLAQLARQSPDLKSSLRVQALLIRSLQPIWEGLVEHRWSEPQLALLQTELTRFDLVSDHTNAIQRTVRAYVHLWQAIAEGEANRAAQLGRGTVGRSAGAWQPRYWWYDDCIQLYRAGQKAVSRFNGADGKVATDYALPDTQGLPLDPAVIQLFQQGPWWGMNPSSVSFTQTALNQATIACALERYRLEHGHYPETLSVLLPDYLERIPPDLVRGRPLTYEREDPNGYLLRGAGADGRIQSTNKTSDDWLWAFPTNAPSN